MALVWINNDNLTKTVSSSSMVQFNCKNAVIYSSWLVSSLSLQASRECQSKEKLLEQGFRSAFREFQQWLVNAKINTAKCFDVPQNVNEASSSLQKIQVQHSKSNVKKHSGTNAARITDFINTNKRLALIQSEYNNAEYKRLKSLTTCLSNHLISSSLLRSF